MYHTRPVDERHEDSILLEELIEEACDIEKLNDGTQWKKYIAYACEFVEKMSKMEVEIVVKTWNAERLGKNQEGQICYEVCCRKSEEPALRKILEVFFNLNGE